MNGASNHAEFAGSGIPPKLMERPGQRWSVVLVMLAAAGAAAILFSFNPAQYGFYPVCYFHAATGLNCPGCGSLRALHQLLHGHVAETARHNLLLLLCLPFLAGVMMRFVMVRRHGQAMTFAVRSVWLWTFLFVAV